jgi:hypothetical protein
MPGKRSGTWAGRPAGPEDQVCQLLVRAVFWALDSGGSRISPLLVVDDYNQAATANHKGTKDAKRDSWRSSSFAIFAGFGLAAPGSPSTIDQAVRARATLLRTGVRVDLHGRACMCGLFGLGKRENVTAFSGYSDLYSRYPN